MPSRDRRRRKAIMQCLAAIAEIAERNHVCPACLAMSISGGILELSQTTGIDHVIDRHEGDERLEGTATQ